MELSGRLRKALGITAREFNGALELYDPAPGRDNTYPERMVSYYFIRALARALANSNVLLEIPITGRTRRGWDNHIDALVFNDDEIVVAEFKVGWAPSHWMALAKDLERLQRPSVAKEIRNCLERSPRGAAIRHQRPYIVLGSDCWFQDRANAWKAGSKSGNWVLPKAMLPAKRDYLAVYDDEGADFDGYYFTWALMPFPGLKR